MKIAALFSKYITKRYIVKQLTLKIGNMNIIILRCVTLLCLISAINVVLAEADKHAHSDIISTAKYFVDSAINKQDDSTQVQIKSLDKRLQLHKCEIPLQGFWPPGASQVGHSTVGIRCNDKKPWKIFVSVQIKQFEQVWVTTSAISRGTILSNKNVAVENREISFTHSEYFNQQHSPLGLMAKRPLRKGDIIQVLALEKPMAVKRGDRVVVVARLNGLEIRTAATALSSAAEGDRIRVRNLSSNKELEGILSKNSVVQVNI